MSIKKARKKKQYRKSPEEENNIKIEYGRKGYHNMSKEKKQKLKEYQKNCRITKKLK